MAKSNVHMSKGRGWAALIASLFIIVLMGGIWWFLASAIAQHRLVNPNAGTAGFLGQMFTAFALIIVAGVLGVFSSVVQIRSGRRPRILTIAILLVFIAAVGVVAVSVSGRHSS